MVLLLHPGIQAAESLHHSSESHGVDGQRFLEDGLGQKVWSHGDALSPGGGWEGLWLSRVYSVCVHEWYGAQSLQEVCYQYWPSSGSKAFGEFTVELLGEQKLTGFITRNLTVINNKVVFHVCVILHTKVTSFLLLSPTV